MWSLLKKGKAFDADKRTAADFIQAAPPAATKKETPSSTEKKADSPAVEVIPPAPKKDPAPANDSTILFEFARSIWLCENIADLPTDPAERKAKWHEEKTNYIGKAKSITKMLENRGLTLTRTDD